MNKILIVEDGMIIAFHAQKLLEANGYSVTEKITLGEAVEESVTQNPPDLILMDIMLEGKMSGLDAALKLRKTSNIPVIFMSALSDNETLEIIDTCDYCFKIDKPFDEGKLLKMINNIFANKSV